MELLHTSLYSGNPGIIILLHLRIPTQLYNTRSQATIFKLVTQGDTYKNSSFSRKINEYNRLPPNIHQIKLEAPFKMALWAHFNDLQFIYNN